MRTPRVCVRTYSFKNRERESSKFEISICAPSLFVLAWDSVEWKTNSLLSCSDAVWKRMRKIEAFFILQCVHASLKITKTLFSSFCVCVTGPNQYFTEKKHALFLINVFRREQSALHKGIKELFLMSKLIKSVSLSFERHELIDFEQITSLSRKTIFFEVENLNSSKLRLEGALKLWPSSN